MTDTTETETTYDTTPGPGQVKHWALFSGGHDSLVATHHLMEELEKTEAVLHLDTRTGLDENEQFVIDTCEEFGWPLRIEQAPITLREFALELGSDDPYGFPGPRVHQWVYSYLKERQLETISGETNGKPHYWTGVRRDESGRRLKHVTEEVEEKSRWVWHAPLADWTNEEMEEYLDEHDLPRNPVVSDIHRSGECFCGAFAVRDEELLDLQAEYPKHFDWIKEIESEAIEVLGADDRKAYWGHGKLSDSELTHLKSLREPEDMMLCRDCRMENQQPGSDTDW